MVNSQIITRDFAFDRYKNTLIHLARVVRRRLKGWRPPMAATGSTTWDVRSEEDIDIGRLVSAIIGQRHPADGILMEDTDPKCGSTDIIWVIDPIDGSLNRIYGAPEFAFGACVMKNNVPCLSIIWSAALDAIVTSWSTVHSRQLRLTRVQPKLIGTGFSGSRHAATRECAFVARVLRHGYAVREFGSCLDGTVRVITGALDGYWERDLSIWDVAPAVPVLRFCKAKLEFGLQPYYSTRRECWMVIEAADCELDLMGVLGKTWLTQQ